MQVTSLLSRRSTATDLDAAGDPAGLRSNAETEQPLRQLRLVFAGLILIGGSYLSEWLLPKGAAVGGLCALVGALILGTPILWTSIRDLRRGVVSINELVSLAVLASFATGDYRTAGVVSFFMLVGEIIETRTAAGARASIESLIQITPTRARRLASHGQEEEVATQHLAVGDRIRVRPGDNIPADGVIRLGAGSVNQATITGESLPVDRKPGDEVFAGTINLTGMLEVEVTRAGGDTTLGRVRELILAAEQSRSPFMRLMDRYMVHYTPLVLTVGALVWVFTHDLDRVISVLVVSCPCAFVLATPTAMVAALSAAARLGVLVKNVGDLELASRINAFVFDKTGTLTTGRLAVCRIAPLAGATPANLLRLVASAERHSNHPAARALVQLASEAGVELAEARDFQETAGRGVRALIDGHIVLAGRARWLEEQGVPPGFAASVDLDENEGHSLIFVALDGTSIGWFALRDDLRSEAPEALADLKQAGVLRLAMVTGDRRPVATRVSHLIACDDVVADCLPQDKVDYVRAVRERGYRVAVVGDGVNDAPALAAGDLGIAMGAAGSEVAIHTASIALMNSDLRRLPFLVRLSRAARTVIHQNFFVGIVFIVGGLSMAALGYLNPIVAAILHNAGSLLVVFNSARLVRAGEEFENSPGTSPQAKPSSGEPTHHATGSGNLPVTEAIVSPAH
jgi:Cd2+/Zn2+-exporting ATPase